MKLITGILHEDEVTIKRTEAGPPDDDGVPTRTTTEHVWEEVNVQQTMAVETHDHTSQYNRTRWRVSGPPVDVKSSDIIVWRGEEYEVDGEPQTTRGRYKIESTTLFMVEHSGITRWVN